MLMIDIAHLRRINDNLGIRCGDAILLEVTRRVAATLRQSDVLGRVGGAELAVFLSHTDPLGALDAAERIRLQVAASPFRWEQAHVVVTVSVSGNLAGARKFTSRWMTGTAMRCSMNVG